MITREVWNMNEGWKFHDGDIEAHNQFSVHDRFIHPEYVKAGNHSLAKTIYDDSHWADVTVPHDFVVERNVYTKEVPSCTGALTKGIVWYRKTFSIPKEDEGKRLFLQFDGIYRDSQVWINGNLAGRHIGGYMGFECEVTELLNYDGHNSIAVKVDATEYEGWWYEGGGIYRDVRLVKTAPVRLIENELYVKTEHIDLNNKDADLTLYGEIESTYNQESLLVSVDILNPQGDIIVTKNIQLETALFESNTFEIKLHLEEIDLWDMDNRALYTASVSVKSSNGLDVIASTFGLRTIDYSAEHGFRLNDVTVKLKGVCGHDDLAGVGVALTRPTIAYKIKKLMEMGVNAYRCAHNPPSPIFLDLCDEMGMLVFDETRLSGVNGEDLGDFIDLIKRDRNHPSVISWSMGNEEMAIHQTPVGVKIYNKMMGVGGTYDNTRPYLYAINCDFDNIVDYDRANGLLMNPVGLNYFVPHDDDILTTMHNKLPELCMINTEIGGHCFTRDFIQPRDNACDDYISESGRTLTTWLDDRYKNKITCYGSNKPKWGTSLEESWKAYADKNYTAGLFLWTGFDYRGEVFPYDYPATISFYGMIDYCGFPKDWAYYMKAMWTEEDVLHLMPHWNLPVEEGTLVDVLALTNCEEVELFVNGTSKGKKSLPKYEHVEWEVAYEKGTIEAVGYRDGVEILRDKKVTAGQATKLVLEVDKDTVLANHDDAVFVVAHLEDEAGNMVITNDEVVEFTFDGPCEFVGTGNGDNLGSEPDKEPRRTLFVGKCLAIVKSTYEAGEIKITGHWNGQETTIKVASVETETLKVVESVVAETKVKASGKQGAADNGI